MRSLTTNTAPGSAGQNGAHTPGPWEYFSNSVGVGVTSAQADVAHCHGLHCERKRPEVEANARLIAAAPQMIEALQELQQHWHHMIGLSSPPEFHRLNDKLVSAIAAATGEEG